MNLNTWTYVRFVLIDLLCYPETVYLFAKSQMSSGPHGPIFE